MQWYFFILPKTQDSFNKENRIIDLLSKLIRKFNEGKRKGTLLLYQKPKDLEYNFYYITTPKKEIIKFFIRLNKAQPCFAPEFNSSVEVSEMKFLTGDVILWLNLIDVHK